MELKSFSVDFPVLKDISIVKNYFNDKELKILNNIVSGYFDFTEIQAMRHNPMYMADYVEHLDNVLKTTGEKVLQGIGTISHAQAIEKATEEYRKYQEQNLSPIEKEYLNSIKIFTAQRKKRQELTEILFFIRMTKLKSWYSSFEDISALKDYLFLCPIDAEVIV